MKRNLKTRADPAPLSFVRQEHLRAYIISNPCQRVKRRRSYFLKKSHRDITDDFFKEHPVFFKKNKAFMYARFICQESMIVEAYVPKKAIVVRLENLTIRPQYIENSCIRRFYPNLLNQGQYITNEAFSIELSV